MKGKLSVYYDEEGDFLELHVGKYTKGYFRDIGDGIAECVDEQTGKVTGIAILGFKERTQGQKELQVSLPLNVELNP